MAIRSTISRRRAKGTTVTRRGPAPEINREHRLAGAMVQRGLQHARRCGELMMQHKARLGHGQFTQWVSEHCQFSARTARRACAVLAAEHPHDEIADGRADSTDRARWRQVGTGGGKPTPLPPPASDVLRV